MDPQLRDFFRLKPDLSSAVSPAKRFPASLGFALALCLMLGLGLADYFVPAPLSFASLYLLLVGYVGWRLGKWPAWLVAMLSIVALDLVYWGRQPGSPALHGNLVWNTAIYLIAFGGVVWVTAGLQRANKVVGESERKYRRLHETMRDAFASVDMSGRILEFNRAFETLLGYTPDELRTRSYGDLTPERWHADEARIIAEQILPRGYSEVYEKEYLRKDGTIFPVELRTFLVRGDDGKPVAMWAIVRNITERRQAAEALQEARDHLEERVQERTAELEAVNSALRESEERYRSLVNNLNVGVFRNTPGPEGLFLEANPALARMFGYNSIEKFLRVKVSAFYQEPGERSVTMRELLRTGKFVDFELRLKRKDGQLIYATVTGTAHRGANGDIDWFDGVIEDVTERRRLERQILEISDDEQARIGQDIHDGLCQELVGLAFDANSLVTELARARQPEQARAQRMADSLDHAITEARQMARGLFPIRLEGDGLGPALDQLAQGAAERFAVNCRFEQIGDLKVPSKAVATQLYRLAQEALNNALKHSQGKNICVRLELSVDLIQLQIEDDGVGKRCDWRQGGMGLHIMRYRARSIGASLEVSPGLQGGTVVRCRLIRASIVKPERQETN